MATFATELGSVAPGAVEIEVPFPPGRTQQDEFFDAGLGTAVLAGTCGCAAPTLMAPGMPVLTAEIEVNLLAPRSASPCGRAARSCGAVVAAPRSAGVMRAGGSSTHVASTLSTMSAVTES